MNLAPAFLALAFAPFEEPRSELAHHGGVTAYAVYGYGGSTAVRINGRRIELPLPKDCWPESNKPRIRPVFKFFAHKGATYLAVTLNRRSGVYGYRQVAFYAISGGQLKEVSTPALIDFSDFGSWSFDRSTGLIALWDMHYHDSVESHFSSHQFDIRWFRLSRAGLVQVSVVRTKSKYHPYNHVTGELDDKVADDPLREVGLRWRWWGE